MDDDGSYTRFYEAHRDQLHAAVAVTLGDPQLAEEAVDEAFVRAAERWQQVRGLAMPAGWVYRVAVNWAHNWRRHRRSRPLAPLDRLDRPYADVVPDVDLEQTLAALPLRQRQLLVLRYGLQFSVAEIAITLGMAEGTVMSSLHRARKKLSTDLEILDEH